MPPATRPLAILAALALAAARSWLSSGRGLRAIGAVYDAARPAAAFAPASLVSDYGIVAFVRRTRATTVLPIDDGG